MEHVLLRFPMVAQWLFEQLNAESLVNCRSVTRTWQQFIDNQKFPSIQKIGALSKLPISHWQMIFQQINHEVVTEFNQIVSKFFHDHPKEIKHTPMHFIAIKGDSIYSTRIRAVIYKILAPSKFC